MLIPALHFSGDCERALALYEKAFNTKAEGIVRHCDYDPANYAGDRQISHSSMKIHGQMVFLNDNEELVDKKTRVASLSTLLYIFRQKKNCWPAMRF